MLVLEILKKYHKGDLAGHCPIYICKYVCRTWASPAFLEGGGGGGGQDRARGRHLTAAYTLSAFGRFNQWGWGGGGVLSALGQFNQWGVGSAVHFQPIQPVGGGGGGGRWVLSAFGRFNQWGGGGAVHFRPIQPMGGGGGADVSFRPIQSMRCPCSRQIQPVDGGCCPLSANSASGGAHVCKQGGGGGGGGGAIQSRSPPWGHPCRWVDECGLMDGQMHGHILYSCMYMHTNTTLWLTFSFWFYFLLQC